MIAFYILILFITVMLSNAAEVLGNSEDPQRRKWKPILIFVLIFFLCFISGFRYMNYYLSDEYNYRVEVNNSIGMTLGNYISDRTEPVFAIMQWIAGNIFHSDQVLIFFTSVVTITSLVLYLLKNSKNFTMTMFLFIAGNFYFTTWNIVRQCLAAAIIVWCIELAQKKKIIPYMILVVLASGIHLSAWICIPLYFIFRKQKLDKSGLVIALASIIFFLYFDDILRAVLSDNDTYGHYISQYETSGYGTSIFRILAWMIPYVLILYKHEYFEKVLGIKAQLMFCVILAAGVNLLSYRYVFVARIGVYFSYPALCVVSSVPDAFDERTARFVTYMMCLLYFLFGCYQMRVGSAYHNMLLENISGVLH